MAGLMDDTLNLALAGTKAAEDAALAAAKNAEVAAKNAEAAALAATKTAEDIALAATKTAEDAALAATKTAEDTALASQKIVDDAIAKIDEILKQNPTLAAKVQKNSSILEFMAKNPGYTALAAGIVIFGAVIFANALIMASEDIRLSIVTMKILDQTKPTIAQIIYEPATKIAKGDELTISGNTNIIPDSIINKKLDFDDIVSKTEISVNIPDLITPATYGSLKLSKDFDNCLKEAAEEVSKNVDDATGNIFSELYEKFKKAILITGVVIGAIIVFLIVMKFIQLAHGK